MPRTAIDNGHVMQDAQPKMRGCRTISLCGSSLSLPCLGILLALSSPVLGGDYFDSSFLALSGETHAVDLSVFSKKGAIAEGEYSLAVFVNGQDSGQYKLAFKKNSQQQIEPVLTVRLLAEWGVNIQDVPGLKSLAMDAQITALSAVIPEATTRLDLSRLRLDLSIPQIAMQPTYLREANPARWQEGITALLFNYTVSGGRSRYQQMERRASSENNNLFASLHGGANYGAWRLRSTMTSTRSDYQGASEQAKATRRNTQFTQTYLARDVRGLRSTLLLGETNSGGDVFDSIAFKGIQLSSSEQMVPSQLRGFAPAISGVATGNARITVRQNGNIVYETYVAAGPFYINDIQQAGLAGDYDVTVTEAGGAERRFRVPYSSLPTMQRPGGFRYELAAGRYNGNMTQGSRQSDFALLTGVYGLPANLTWFGGVLLAQDYQAVNTGAGLSLGDLGAISLDATQAQARFSRASGPAENKTGQSYRLRYSKSLVTTGTSVDLTALRYSTEHYYNFSEFNSQGYGLEPGISPWTLQRRRSSFQTQLSQRLAEYGTLHLRANRDEYWGREKTLTGLSFGYSRSFKGVGIGINYNIDRMQDRDGHWPENRQVSVNLSVPWQIFSPSTTGGSMYATTAITHDNQGRTQNQLGVSGSLLDSDLSYSLSQGWGNQGQVSLSNATLGYQGSKGSISAGYSYSRDASSINMNASGGGVVHAGGLTLARSMGESVALVDAPGAEGALLVNGGGTIDARGYAVVPYLTDYAKNSVGIDPTTLPENVDVVHSNATIYPSKGAVIKVNIATRLGYQVLMTLEQSNHQPIPFGAIATLMENKSAHAVSGIISDFGQVYLAGLPEQGQLQVQWGAERDKRCRVNFSILGIKATKDNPIRQMTAACQ